MSQNKIDKENKNSDRNQVPSDSDLKYKKIVSVMSWILGISFFLVILLPNFIPPSMDIMVKVLFFIGFITLLGFAFLELFGKKIKIHFDKHRSNIT